jgi:hypothetical protein
MNIIEEVYIELSKHGLHSSSIIDLQEIRNKDGIYLFRVICENENYVLKYFLKEEYIREIKNYSILKELSIPTIKVFSYTDRSLLLEDLEKSERYRLGEEGDLVDTEIARVLANWYIDLHNKGVKYIQEKDINLYREIDIVTEENIILIKNSSNTRDNPVWNLILDNFDLILKRIKKLEETLTYNDFYWTNFAVSNDKKEAVMFDYNLLGIGFRYNDIRNICSSLSKEAAKAFIEVYGNVNEGEKIIDDGISIIINLIFAYKRPTFPRWAKTSLDAIHNGELEEAIQKILENN